MTGLNITDKELADIRTMALHTAIDHTNGGTPWERIILTARRFEAYILQGEDLTAEQISAIVKKDAPAEHHDFTPAHAGGVKCSICGKARLDEQHMA